MANEVDTTLLDNLNSIKNSKADIKQALIDKGQNPTNVFADYAQLIGDIQTGEDLTEVLNTQDQKIAELEATLENKTAGENAKLNIFVQTTEPTSKDGIWIQVDKTLEHIVEDDDYYIEGEYDVDGKYRNIPYNFYCGSAVAIGTDIYLFGSYESTYQKTAYKYNTLTDTYTQLADIPYSFLGSVAVTVADKIFLLGGRSYPTKIQCYETATKTYENNTAVIVQGIYYSSSYLVKLLNVEGSLVSENQYLKYAFKKALFYDETDGLQDTLPVYYGNGTKWTQI